MMIIRPEEPRDRAAIRQVVEAAFGQPQEAHLVDLLRDHGKVTFSLVAEKDERVVGHILFSPVTIESNDESLMAIGLAPLAVLPELQNEGIGSQLMHAGLEACRAAGHECVVVLGHPRYYPRFGFVPASRYGVRCEYDVPDEHFMLIELRAGALAGHEGLVKYQPEFNQV